MDLKHLSRKVIRNTLLAVTPDQSLFKTIPKLPLPSLLRKYLLFNTSDECQSDENLCTGAKCPHAVCICKGRMYTTAAARISDALNGNDDPRSNP